MSLFSDDERREVDDAAMERALGWMSKHVDDVSQAIAQRQHLEQYVKSVEAQQKMRWADAPANVQERNARGSDEYVAVLEAFKEASFREQRARYQWQLAQTVIDVWRTQQANHRRIG